MANGTVFSEISRKDDNLARYTKIFEIYKWNLNSEIQQFSRIFQKLSRKFPFAPVSNVTDLVIIHTTIPLPLP